MRLRYAPQRSQSVQEGQPHELGTLSMVSANETRAQDPALLAIAVGLLGSTISALAPNFPTWGKLLVLGVAVVLTLWAAWAFFSAHGTEEHSIADRQQATASSRAPEEPPTAGGQPPRGIRSISVVLFVGIVLGAAIVTIVVNILGVEGGSSGPIELTFENPPEGGTYSSPGTLSGRVTNLSPGEMVWTFNQKYDPKTGRLQLPFFANPGPCAVADGKWSCEGVYVGDSTKDNGRQFAVWAAVVNEEQAQHIVGKALVNTYKGGPGLPEEEVPHVTGVAPVKRMVTINNPGP